MNLCGGMDIVEPELLITTASDDHNGLSASPKMKVSTPTRRRPSVSLRTPTSSRRNSRQSPSMSSSSPNTPQQNLLSKEEMIMPRTRARHLSSPLNSLKTLSAMVTKLEKGFAMVVRTAKDATGRTVFVNWDPDTAVLRVRPRIDEGTDSDRDALKDEHPDIMIKIQDITRLDVGVGRPTKRLGAQPATNPKPVKCFSLVVTRSKSVGDSISLDFEAKSLVERDSAVSAITGLQDKIKDSLGIHGVQTSRDCGNAVFEEMASSRLIEIEEQFRPRSNLSPLKRTHIHSGTPKPQSLYSGRVLETPRTPLEQGTETSLAFDFNTPESVEGEVATSERKISLPTLNGNSKTAISTLQIGRRASTPDLPSYLPPPRTARNSSSTTSPDDAARDNSLAASDDEEDVRDMTRDEDKENGGFPDDEVVELSVTIIESDGLKIGSVDVTGSEWSASDEWHSSKAATDTGSSEEENDNRVERKNTIKYEYAPTTVSVLQASLSTALTNVDDDDLVTMANQMADPWCTDDICTAALKDVAEACKGIFHVKQERVAKEAHSRGEIDYLDVLGNNSAIVKFLSVRDVWNGSSTKSSNVASISRVQNRASKMNEQAVRRQKLRSEMTFEAAERREKMYFLQTVNSCDDLDRAGRKNSRTFAQASNVNDQFDILQQMVGIVSKEPAKADDSEILYYDSDPEFVRERRLRKGPRRVTAERNNALEVEEKKKSRPRTLSGISIDRLRMGGHHKTMDEGLVAEVIEAMKNEKMTLVWHPTQTEESPNRAPVCVKVWIESGVYLIDGTFLLPKLTWIPMYEGNLHSKLLNVSRDSPDTMDLLDVCRLRECESVDRRLHPYARTDRSFVIQTQDEILLFEAQCTKERSRIVNGLKLVIARLASLLMLRDLRAVDEFFGGGSVPGEAPEWAQKKSENSTSTDDSASASE